MQKEIVAISILYARKVRLQWPWLFLCYFQSRQSRYKSPLFCHDLTLFQAYNKDVNDPCNNFTTGNVSLPVQPLRFNRHKPDRTERTVSFCTSLHTARRSYKRFTSISSFILTWALFFCLFVFFVFLFFCFHDVKRRKLVALKLV